MITKLVKRYYCEHCRKGGQTKAIADHELTCVKNPDRVCWVCREYGLDEQAAMPALLAAAEDGLNAVSGIPSITSCPACTLAALFQYRKLHPEAEWQEYDYKAALLAIQKEHNAGPYL